MNYRGTKDVRVYNECPFQVNITGQKRDYIFPPAEDGEPTMNFIDFEDIEYMSARYKAFSIGLLTFNEDEREDIYSTLGLKNWKSTVWYNDDIEDIILHPTVEKMQRIINIVDSITLERVRGMMVRFVNEKRDVSQNVINIVNARYRELSSGRLASKIVVRPDDVENKATSEDVDELKRQLAEMKAMMEKMVASQSSQYFNAQENAKVESESKSTSSTVTRRGTPANRAVKKTTTSKK